MSSRSIVVGMAFFVLACTAPQAEVPRLDITAARAQIDSLWAQYTAAAVAGDGEAIARLYTDSMYLVEGGLPTVRSNTELRALVKDVLASVRFLEARIQPETTELLGDRVLQFGVYRDVLQQSGQPAQAVYGRFSAVLQKDPTGSWRVGRLIAVPDSTVAHQVKPQ